MQPAIGLAAESGCNSDMEQTETERLVQTVRKQSAETAVTISPTWIYKSHPDTRALPRGMKSEPDLNRAEGRSWN